MGTLEFYLFIFRRCGSVSCLGSKVMAFQSFFILVACYRIPPAFYAFQSAVSMWFQVLYLPAKSHQDNVLRGSH
uniref:Uncharacterized protein n=1 Tax=Anguilla anguilla TaxID=7936 RepID=A0A0E9VXU1_ANGAN